MSDHDWEQQALKLLDDEEFADGSLSDRVHWLATAFRQVHALGRLEALVEVPRDAADATIERVLACSRHPAEEVQGTERVVRASDLDAALAGGEVDGD